MSKRNKINKVSSYSSDSDEMMRMVKILGILVGIFLIFYLVFAYFNGEFSSKDTKEQQEIQNVEIIAGTTFNRSDSEYYVLFYDFDGPEAVYLDYLFNTYASLENKYIYKVDLGNGFNKKFVSNETNSKASKASELKVKDATLMKVQEGKNVLYVEGSSQVIANALK